MDSFISWIGGKKLLRKRVVEEFPESNTYDRYVEVFGGAGWVLFLKDKHAGMEVYNDVNGNRFVPSASGSLDRRDYKAFREHKDDDFQTLLQYGMYRELQEECYVDVKQYTDTHFQLLGCARLMSKAGKPDFFAKLEIKVQHEDEIQKMLAIYDSCQKNQVGRKHKELESNKMVLVDKDSFLATTNFDMLLFSL